MNIYLTRHSKTIWNLEKRLQGRKDSPLCKEGKENALALKKYISDISFDCVYSSPIERAYHTAKLITNDKIIKDDRLMEMDFGDFEGMKIADILNMNFELYDNMWNHPEKFNRIPHGESYDEVMDRVISFFDELKEKEYQNVLIVTHGMLFINILAYMLKLKREDYVQINQRVVDGCSLTLFKEQLGQYEKVFIGKNDFLPNISNEIFNK
jgi:Fructose-2,6-bisphosphatase